MCDERLSREQWIMRYGPDDARQAIINLRAGQARQGGGGPPAELIDAQRPTNEEPPPSEGVTYVWPSAWQAFSAAFERQYQKGLERYPHPLQTLNGRDPYRDLLDKQADAVMYGTQLYLEARTFAQLTVRAVQLLDEIMPLVWNHCDFLSDAELSAFMTEAQACLKKSGLSRSLSPGST